MQMKTAYYPISIKEIEEKVKRKTERFRQGSIFTSEAYTNIKKIVNDFGETITRIDGDIPPDLPINNGERFLFISYSQSALTHGLHKYPAKFFPELPRWLIQRYSRERELVLDPFSGSGTTNVEALLSERHSIGIDVDPFSRFISTVKTTPLDEQEILDAKETLLKNIVEYHQDKVLPEDIPEFPYRDNWFNPEIIRELAYLKKIILSLEVSQETKNFFLVCFSSIIRSVSNADDNCTRTVIRKKLNKRVYPSAALVRFTETILTEIPKVIEFSSLVPRGITVQFPGNMDARFIDYPANTFDLAVTSPPYVNAVDYPRTHQLEIYWLGFASGSLTPLKRKHVGTESVSAEEYKDFHEIGVPEADQVMKKIYEKDPRRAYIAFKYLQDMETNFKEVFRVLKPGCRYVLVVGNNQIRGYIFENWKYFIAIAERNGFKLESYFASEIIKHFIKIPREERITTDWVLVFKK